MVFSVNMTSRLNFGVKIWLGRDLLLLSSKRKYLKSKTQCLVCFNILKVTRTIIFICQAMSCKPN